MKNSGLCALSVLCLLVSGIMHGEPVQLRCNLLPNPLGIDDLKPRFSWRSESNERNWRQGAYRIQVASSLDKLNEGSADVWDSGKQSSDESVSVPYGGPPLRARNQYFWTVTVWDAKGHSSKPKEPAHWEMGLLDTSDWQSAKWIRWQDPEAVADNSGIHWIWLRGQDVASVPAGTLVDFRTTVNLAEKPERAALYVTAHSGWKVTVNGQEDGEKS